MKNLRSTNKSQPDTRSASEKLQAIETLQKKQQAFEKFQRSNPETNSMLKAIELLNNESCNVTEFESSLTTLGYGKAPKIEVNSKDPEVITALAKQTKFDAFQSTKPSTGAIMKAWDMLHDETCNETQFESYLKQLG